MAKHRFTRRHFLISTAPALAVAPLAGLGAVRVAQEEASDHGDHGEVGAARAGFGHGAMIGDAVPAVGGPNDLDRLLYPPEALPHAPGRVREYELVASEGEWEIFPGIHFPAWMYNGTVPGPIVRATEGDLLRVRFANASRHPHTIHFHGIHPASMDGVFELVGPGESFTYEFPARPYGMHLYHCHVSPIKKHIQKGLYGALIVDPPRLRPPAQELVMVMNGYDTDGDGANNFYSVNGRAFYHAKYPIRVRRSQTVRIYLANLTELDLINSFHLHGDMFRLYRTGTTDVHEYTDTVMLCQGERCILEVDFANTGHFMFHAHQSEFTDLGWMGFFEVVD